MYIRGKKTYYQSTTDKIIIQGKELYVNLEDIQLQNHS
jgi:hypothetical protein